jgi:hypothetical protein
MLAIVKIPAYLTSVKNTILSLNLDVTVTVNSTSKTLSASGLLPLFKSIDISGVQSLLSEKISGDCGDSKEQSFKYIF